MIMNTRRIWVGWVAGFLLVCGAGNIGAVQGSGEQIGQVLGTAVYREQIQQAEGQPLSYELFRLFFQPLMSGYYTEHQQELQPTAQEIDVVTAFWVRKHQETVGAHQVEIQAQLDDLVRKLAQPNLSEDERMDLEIQRDMLSGQLQPPDSRYAEWLLGSWKFQRHLYLTYGGGKILWQQTGFEAFDATYQWLLQQERSGAFAITDEDLRSAFYAYWTTLDHGTLLIDDQATIEQEFLSPEWARGILNR